MLATVQFAYPSPAELREVERQLLPTLTLDDPAFDLFPIVETAAWRLKWRQRDNFMGAQQVRGLGGEFKVVDAPGMKDYDVDPGVYGESALIEEEELTTAAEAASYTEFATLNDVVADRQAMLLSRRLTRIRKVLWDLLATGRYQVFDKAGTLKHVGSFPLTRVTAGVPWSTRATATPYADLTALPLQARGQSASFGRGAVAYVNRKKLNDLLLNANPADLFGRRLAAGSTVNSQAELNGLLAGQADNADIPDIRVYDEGYISDGTDGLTRGQWYPFIPDNVAVVVGKRASGARLGEYRMCRNANNPDFGPGPYTRVRDLREVRSPAAMLCEDGHNGGPAVYFPGAVIILAC
jgi:hypothetical protein